MVNNGPQLNPPDLSSLDDFEPEVVQVELPMLPELPAVRPKGGPDLPFEE